VSILHDETGRPLILDNEKILQEGEDYWEEYINNLRNRLVKDNWLEETREKVDLAAKLIQQNYHTSWDSTNEYLKTGVEIAKKFLSTFENWNPISCPSCGMKGVGFINVNDYLICSWCKTVIDGTMQLKIVPEHRIPDSLKTLSNEMKNEPLKPKRIIPSNVADNSIENIQQIIAQIIGVKPKISQNALSFLRLKDNGY
jgi:hypothetical protein